MLSIKSNYIYQWLSNKSTNIFKNTQVTFTNYVRELNSVDLMSFNKFILTQILARALKFNTIVPIMAAMSVVAFSLSIQAKFYVFIPQSSITAFASYVIFASVTSILLLVLYPLAIIIMLNYIGHKIRNPLKSLFLPTKILVLAACFYLCIIVMGSSAMTILDKIYIACLWTLLYFVLINIYTTYNATNSLRDFGKIKIMFTLLLVALSIQPFLILFVYTSEMINYTSVNSKIYLTQTNCNLITTPIGDIDRSKNMAINNPGVYQAVSGGCYINGNSIRYGFGGDYVLIFKKNMKPIVNSQNKEYNAYVRLTCYASNCYAQDNIFTSNDKDSQNDLMQSDKAWKIRRMKKID